MIPIDKELLESDEKIPFVSYELTDYLSRVFNLSDILNKEVGSESMRLGYIKGIQDVLSFLQWCQKQNVGE